MSERYSKLFALPENLYATDSPVIIAAGALLKDSQTGKVLAQLKLRNIGMKTIKAATVLVKPMDTADKPLGETVTYRYLDLHVERDADFGQKAPIVLPDAATRAFAVSVAEVVFADNSIWSEDTPEWKPLDCAEPLETVGDSELAKQFRIEYGSDCENLLLEQNDLWHCACGAVNRREESNCHKCGKALDELRAVDMDDLRIKRDERVAREQQAAEEQAKIDAALKIEKEKRYRKLTAIGLAISAACILAVLLITNVFIPPSHCKKAEQLLADGETAKAAIEYGKAGSFSDARERSFELWADVTRRDVIAVGDEYVVAVKNDGTVIASQGIKASEDDDYDGQCDVDDWTDIIAISAGNAHTVGLKADGTVVACGHNSYGQCDVGDWENIVAISAGSYHTVGLRADGTVVAVGDNEEGQCNVSDWEDIIAIAAGGRHTAGLKSDGTAVAVGDGKTQWKYGTCDVDHWTDIVYIDASLFMTVGVKSDGTVVATGGNGEYVKDWTKITQVACDNNIFGLTEDGMVLYEYNGNLYSVLPPEERDAVAVACDGSDAAVVKEDGSVYSNGGVWNVDSFDDWTNIKTP